MAQKKSSGSEKSKNQVSTELIVALIGLMGTLVVAFFGFLNTRTAILLPASITQTFQARQTPVSDFFTQTPSAIASLEVSGAGQPSAEVSTTTINTASPKIYDANSILTFDNIVIESTNPDWSEVSSEDWRILWDFGIEPARRYWTIGWGVVATPSFDIAIINRTDASILVTDIGIQLIGIKNLERAGGGSPPGSERVEIADAYIIQMPDFKTQYSAEKWDQQTNMETELSTRLPDPIYMQPQAPFRYILILDQYRPNMPTDVIFRMWVKTSAGEATSSLIELNTGP